MRSIQPVILDDDFWGPRLEVNARRAIFHQWRQLEASGCIANFRILAGEQAGFREGWFFADSDAYKWLDAAARITANHPSTELSALMDNFIALLGRAQAPDGYLYTYNQIHFPNERWVNLQIEHELYCHGHLIEAGVSHHLATSRDDLLDIARRAADRIVADFRGAGPEGTDGHEEIEIALLRLYRLTREAAYLELAQQFLEQRGRKRGFAHMLMDQKASSDHRANFVKEQRQSYLTDHPEEAIYKLPPGNTAKQPPGGQLRWQLNAVSGKYFQQHVPLSRLTVPVGHAVRFGYLETAAAMLEREMGGAEVGKDETRPYLPAMRQAWEHMVTRRMYVTGGLGALPSLEGFGEDYELDPEYAYAETCAALAGMFWTWELAQLTGEAQYSDLFEWLLYNAAAPGLGLSGDTYLYNNPLAVQEGVTRKAWYAVPCCPSNLSRTWADLGKYIYSNGTETLTVHQYIGNRTDFVLSGVPVQVEMVSGLPWEGQVRLCLEPATAAEFTISLRIPAWAAEVARVMVNGQPVDLPPVPAGLSQTAGGYDPRLSRFVKLQRTWHPGDIIEMHLEMPITLRRAHPNVKGHMGKAALTCGPLVYCLESSDNPGVDIFKAQLRPDSLRVEPAPDLLGGIRVLRGETDNRLPLTFIPYHLWANRGESQMTVWVNVLEKT